ncbi:MAG: hypothetical protein EXR63_02015 [Dehalococcoidia bacterium]|nr:hypothetical protein [Dehalococcoidia bacterium]
MALRLLPWAPEYGTALQADAHEAEAAIDVAVEGPWRAVAVPARAALPSLCIVDGVRRAEAHALDEGPGGELQFGLFGSYATGAVVVDRDGARVIDDAIHVERRLFQTGGAPSTLELRSGAATLRFRAQLPPQASSANDLVAALNRAMLGDEAKLAERLSRDTGALTLVDGPLWLRSPGPRVVGYVKRVHRWYLDGAQQRLLVQLRVGERTPLFRILEGGHERSSWYLRIAELSPHFHPLAGVVRLEAPGALPTAEVVALAEQCAAALPRLASSPVRDPRSPQNLIAVGALERELTRRLGDRRWVARLLHAHVGGARPAASEPSPPDAMDVHGAHEPEPSPPGPLSPGRGEGEQERIASAPSLASGPGEGEQERMGAVA